MSDLSHCDVHDRMFPVEEECPECRDWNVIFGLQRENLHLTNTIVKLANNITMLEKWNRELMVDVYRKHKHVNHVLRHYYKLKYGPDHKTVGELLDERLKEKGNA